MVKRAANDDNKRNLNKKTKLNKNKALEVDENAEKKRKLPITNNQSYEVNSDEESDEDDDQFEEVPQDSENELDNDQDVELDDSNDNNNNSKERHAQQKEKAAIRKAQKPHSELVAKAKIHWERVRQKKSITKEERQKHLIDLINVVKGHMKDVIFKHDASRIIQSIVKWGNRSERDLVAQELDGSYLQLAQDKYANFLLTKLIRYCPTHRSKILQSFHGHVPRLLLHKYAAGVIEDAFALYANSEDRQSLVRDFYGKEFALFNNEKKSKTLKDLLESEPESKRLLMMDNIRNTLQSIFEHPDKGAITHSIVHRALWEYMSALTVVYNEEEADKKRKSLLDDINDLIPEIVHTRDGSRATREFIATSTPKDRKLILKSIKPHIEKMATDDQAQLVLFTALDAIDDTRASSTTIVSSLTKSSKDLAFDKNGRRSLHYLLTPRSTKHFTPDIVYVLKETDGILSKTSKKDANIRHEEIIKFASKDLLQAIEDEPKKLIMDAGASLLVTDIMLYAIGDKSRALDKLINLLEFSNEILEFSPASRVFKTILQGGHFDKSSKKVEISDEQLSKQATEKIWKVLQPHAIKISKTTGTFILAELIESVSNDNSFNNLKEEILNEFDNDKREEIKKSDAKGITVLLEKLNKLESN